MFDERKEYEKTFQGCKLDLETTVENLTGRRDKQAIRAFRRAMRLWNMINEKIHFLPPQPDEYYNLHITKYTEDNSPLPSYKSNACPRENPKACVCSTAVDGILKIKTCNQWHGDINHGNTMVLCCHSKAPVPIKEQNSLKLVSYDFSKDPLYEEWLRKPFDDITILSEYQCKTCHGRLAPFDRASNRDMKKFKREEQKLILKLIYKSETTDWCTCSENQEVVKKYVDLVKKFNPLQLPESEA